MGRLHNTYAIFRSETALLEKAVVLTPLKANQPPVWAGPQHESSALGQTNNTNTTSDNVKSAYNEQTTAESH